VFSRNDHEVEVAPRIAAAIPPAERARPDIGEQVEPLAQLAGRVEPALGRPAGIRYGDIPGPQNDAGGALRLREPTSSVIVVPAVLSESNPIAAV